MMLGEWCDKNGYEVGYADRYKFGWLVVIPIFEFERRREEIVQWTMDNTPPGATPRVCDDSVGARIKGATIGMTHEILIFNDYKRAIHFKLRFT